MQSAAGARRSRLVMVLGMYAVVFVAELVGGIATNSLALLADSGHVFTDFTGIALALGAIWLAAREPTDRRTFGYYRLEILAALLNAVLLFGIGAAVLYEAIQRMSHEAEILTGPMLVIAALGLIANLISAAALREPSRASLNMRGAYLEVIADALGSAAVIVAGVVIALTGFRAADAIASALIGILIVPRTWNLMREALNVLLEGTPKDLEIAHVRRHILETPGVAGVHDLHVWTITSGMNVIAAHVAVHDGADRDNVLHKLSRCLSDDFDIAHSTFQIEAADHADHEEGAHT